MLVSFDCVIQRAQLARAKSEVTRADRTLAINLRLVQLQSVGQLEVDLSRAELEKAQADMAMAEATVSRCKIVAPFSGVTVEQRARPHQYSTPGQALLDVLDNDVLDVELIVPSRWLAWLRPGSMFDIHVDELNKLYPVRVIRLGGKVDAVSQSIKVIAEFTVAAPELMAGMSGRVNLRPPQ